MANFENPEIEARTMRIWPKNYQLLCYYLQHKEPNKATTTRSHKLKRFHHSLNHNTSFGSVEGNLPATR